jgi:2',3'-cyclic-nucleotide 2'-phosphodiesterase (5'-nucleotidase family)
MRKRLLALCTALLLLTGAALPALGAGSEREETLTILFTHDIHDHILPTSVQGGGESGGLTRLAALLRQERDAAPGATVTLDGGDFSMGTLFQTIFTTAAPELRLLGAMGYDATTFGNHEFDYGAQGLADMLNAAVASGESLPALVEANYKPPEDDTTSLEAWSNYGISDYTVLERDGLRVAVFGLIGEDADSCAPTGGMEFEPIVTAARRTVAYLQEYEQPDYIICLSHSGTEDGRGEDYDLAKAVDGIDVILSGHTHTTLTQPIQVNDTLIVSCGPYTQNLGVLTISKTDGAVQMEDYRLIPVDETVEEDPDIAQRVQQFQSQVEREYLDRYGYSYDQVLAVSSFDFTPVNQFALVQEEDGLGDLIADSYVYAIQQAEGEDYVPVDFAVAASGAIRGSFAAGEITVADAFQAASLGIGSDGTAGCPLVSVYLTGAELMDAFEIDASVAPLMDTAQLYGAGMTWTYNTHRMIFNKVTSCGQLLEDGTVVPLEKDRLYRVVANLYCAQMLGVVNARSYGLLTITPKDADGNEITDFEANAVTDQTGTQLKEWVALASYLEYLGQIPEEYSAPQGRKVVQSSWNPIELVKSPNWITLLALLVLAVLILVLVLVIRAIVVRKSSRRYGRSRRGSSPQAYRGRKRKR